MNGFHKPAERNGEKQERTQSPVTLSKIEMIRLGL